MPSLPDSRCSACSPASAAYSGASTAAHLPTDSTPSRLGAPGPIWQSRRTSHCHRLLRRHH
eukprot:13151270-Alexandrium_andersonii.AAC.1